MAVPYQSFLGTQPFVIEGPGGKRFFVHSALIAQHSKVLDRDVNGSMKEATERFIKIEDIDGDINDGTVMRFIEFAYTGDYTVPTADKDECEDKDVVGNLEHEDHPASDKVDVSTVQSSVKLETPNAADNNEIENLEPPVLRDYDDYDFDETIEPTAFHDHEPRILSRRKKIDRRHKSTPTEHWFVQSRETYPTAAPRLTVEQKKNKLWKNFVTANGIMVQKPSWEPRRLDPSTPFDYATDLVCHARLYVFANRYDCVELAKLALQKLALSLSRYAPSDGVKPIITLTTYIYNHTHEYDEKCDKLRSLIIDYLVCHLNKIAKEESFRALLREEGAFADDLMVKSMQLLE